jgi:hypothetical protein
MSWPSAQFVSLEALTWQLSYHVIPLPKLDVVSVNKLLCRFDCCAVVTTIKNYRFHEMTVPANYVCSVVGHSAVSDAVCPIADLLPNSKMGPMPNRRQVLERFRKQPEPEKRFPRLIRYVHSPLCHFV